MKKDILISVIIPIKNGDYWLEETLTSIEKQSLFNCTEIIAIDSESTDASLEILAKHQVRIIHVEANSFNHGLTRNIGVNAAQGKFVVMTVQDAKPVDEFWLQHLLNGFENDDSIAGVCGQQVVPHDLDKNPIEWFRPQSSPSKTKFMFTSRNEFEKLTPTEKRRICGWDNVTAMYRKSVLLQIPFRETSFAEDALWAKDALCCGYSIVYNTNARVYHYHFGDPDFVVRRQFTVFYHFYQYFRYTPTYKGNEIKLFLSNVKTLLPIKELTYSEKLGWLLYNRKLRRSIRAAVALFHSSLLLGENALKMKHLELCGKVPTAIKPKQQKLNASN